MKHPGKEQLQLAWPLSARWSIEALRRANLRLPTRIVAMLVSLSFLEMVVSAAAAPLRSGAVPITPHDPPTLTLALIGAGTVAIYLAARWRPSRRGAAPRWTGRLSDQSEGRDVVSADAAEEREARGAA
jgi:hypothetical protein